MVPQAVGISLCNRIGDSAGEFLVVVLWGFLSAFNDFELLFFLCFYVEFGGMLAWYCLIGVNFVSACLFAFIFMHFSSCTLVFNSQSRIYVVFIDISAYIRGFTVNSHICPFFFILEEY